MTGWQGPDQFPRGIVDSDMDELAQSPVRTDDPERTEFRIGEFHGRLDDPSQGVIQVETGGHREDRFEQRIHPVSGGADDDFHPVLHLDQQFAEPGLRQQPTNRFLDGFVVRRVLDSGPLGILHSLTVTRRIHGAADQPRDGRSPRRVDNFTSGQ